MQKVLGFGRFLQAMFIAGICLLLPACATTSGCCTQDPQVKQFIQQMCARHNFQQAELTRLFAQVKPNNHLVDSMTAPHEALPWYRYRPLFVKKEHAKNGVIFWREHAGTFAKAQQQYGVPPEIILAILGVETNYGHFLGKYRVIDCLSTLAFYYPPRAPYFRGELEQYLLLTRENSLDPLGVLGSYAGAIGQPQFMPSSYRKYSVDTNHKGYSDLMGNSNDAIMSVANYFKGYGWLSGQPIAIRARISGEGYKKLLARSKTKLTIAEFKAYGVSPSHWVAGQQQAYLLPFAGANGPEYWLIFHNFDVIMRYNTSPNYAMAVTQLAELIGATYRHKA